MVHAALRRYKVVRYLYRTMQILTRQEGHKWKFPLISVISFLNQIRTLDSSLVSAERNLYTRFHDIYQERVLCIPSSGVRTPESQSNSITWNMRKRYEMYIFQLFCSIPSLFFFPILSSMYHTVTMPNFRLSINICGIVSLAIARLDLNHYVWPPFLVNIGLVQLLACIQGVVQIRRRTDKGVKYWEGAIVSRALAGDNGRKRWSGNGFAWAISLINNSLARYRMQSWIRSILLSHHFNLKEETFK